MAIKLLVGLGKEIEFTDKAFAEAVRTATKMVEDAPDMKRNILVLAGLLAAAGNLGEARRRVAEVEATTPGLTLDNARLPYFGDGAAGVRFRSLLREAGL